MNYYENHIRKQSVVFTKFASYSVVILTHQEPDSYSALASSLVRVGRSDVNNYRPTRSKLLARAEKESGFLWVSIFNIELEAIFLKFIKLPPIWSANLIRPSDPLIWSAHLIRPSDPPIWSAHLIRPSDPPILSVHLIRQSDPPTWSTHLIRPSDPPILSAHLIRQSDPPIWSAHLIRPSDPPIWSAHIPNSTMAPLVQSTPCPSSRTQFWTFQFCISRNVSHCQISNDRVTDWRIRWADQMGG